MSDMTHAEFLRTCARNTAATKRLDAIADRLDAMERDDTDLRRALKASVSANALYEVMERKYRQLLTRGHQWREPPEVPR